VVEDMARAGCMNHKYVTDKFDAIFNGTAGSPTDDHRTFFKIDKR
jgi:hypothetical protein